MTCGSLCPIWKIAHLARLSEDFVPHIFHCVFVFLADNKQLDFNSEWAHQNWKKKRGKCDEKSPCTPTKTSMEREKYTSRYRWGHDKKRTKMNASTIKMKGTPSEKRCMWSLLSLEAKEKTRRRTRTFMSRHQKCGVRCRSDAFCHALACPAYFAAGCTFGK